MTDLSVVYFSGCLESLIDKETKDEEINTCTYWMCLLIYFMK